MRRKLFVDLLAGCLLLGIQLLGVGPAGAVQERLEELQQSLDRMRAEQTEAGARLDKARAEGAEQRVEELGVHITQLQQRIQDGQRALEGIRRQRHEAGGAPQAAQLGARVEHAVAAAEHLREAGLMDLAEKTAAAAKELRVAWQQQQEHLAREHPQPRADNPPDHGDGSGRGEREEMKAALRELREQIESLRRDVGELQRRSGR